MAKSSNKELRGPRNHSKHEKKLQKLSRGYDINSSRRHSRFGKRRPQGFSLSDMKFLTRNRALHVLQVSLKDFRRLCILKGVYPRVPAKANSKKQTYYAAKDVAFLAHEPVLEKFRAYSAFMKRVARVVGRGDVDDARRMYSKRPTYDIDHLVRERYPTFEAALSDLDDALTLVHLFAVLPAERGVMNKETNEKCAKLVREWQFFVAKSRCLRKVFCSIKGMYYRAEIRGAQATWIVPHKFTPVVSREHVDFAVMRTFVQFSMRMLEFTMFKLYAEELGSAYPPHISMEDDAAGAFLSAVSTITTATSSSSSVTTHEGGAKMNKDNNNEEERKKKHRLSIPEKPLQQSASDRKLALTLERAAAKASSGQNDINEESDDKEDEEDQVKENEEDEQDVAFEQDEAVQQLKHNAQRTEKLTNLFSGAVFWIGREVPFEPLELCACAFGASRVVRQDDVKVDDSSITHVVTDRPNVEKCEGREYVQPQWIFDCINSEMLLPVSGYGPGEMLPPHLSPFVDNDAAGYRPRRLDEIEELRKARAAGGGTEALLSATNGIAPSSSSSTRNNENKRIVELSEEEEEEEEEVEEEAEEDDDNDEDEDNAENHHGIENVGDVVVEKEETFIPAPSFSGTRPGYFFRRGNLGIGYYRDTKNNSHEREKFNAEKSIKMQEKQALHREATEGNAMRTMVMKRGAKYLYTQLKARESRQNAKVHRLERRRQEIEKKQQSK